MVNLTFCLPKVVFAELTTDAVVTVNRCIRFALANDPVLRQADKSGVGC